MKKSVLFLLIGLFTFQIGVSQITASEKLKLETYEFSTSQDFDLIIKITRLTSEETYEQLEKTLNAFTTKSDITLTRNKAGEISYLKFASDVMVCASDESDFGAVHITIKENKVTSCRMADFSRIVGKTSE